MLQHIFITLRSPPTAEFVADLLGCSLSFEGPLMAELPESI